MLNDYEIKTLCESGGLAPSGGNIQPWKVIVRKNSIELKLDPVRATSFIDVGRYASIFSLGSFLENVCITAETLGLKYTVEYSEPDTSNMPCVKIYFLDKEKNPVEHPLYEQIARRVTNRQLSHGDVIGAPVIDDLFEDVNKGSIVKFSAIYKKDEKETVAKILGKTDVIRLYHENLSKQMFDEIRWTQEETDKTRDGIDTDTLELPKLAVKFLYTLKKFPMIKKILPKSFFERMTHMAIMKSSQICLLSLKTELTIPCLLEAGKVLERVWLKATKLDLALQPWTVLPFMFIRARYFPGTGFNKREEEKILALGKELTVLFNLFDSDIPLFIFRISKAPSPSKRSLRLDWKTYTTISHE